MEEPGPGFQTSPLHQFVERRSQVAISPAVGALGLGQVIFADDVCLAGFGQLERFLQEGPQLCEQGDRPASFAVVAIGLRAWHCDTISFPIDMLPFEGQHFRRAAQAAVSGQGDYDLPGRAGQRQHFSHFVAANEIEVA